MSFEFYWKICYNETIIKTNMELTQLQGPNPWEKIQITNGQKIPLTGHEDNVVAHLESSNWQKLLHPIEGAAVSINQQKLTWTTELKHWDTLSLWENQELMYASHEKWKVLSNKEIEEHIKKWWGEVTKEELNDLTALVESNQKRLTVSMSISLIFILIYIVSFTVLYNYYSRNSAFIETINQSLYPTQTEMVNLKNLVWNLKDWEEVKETIVNRIAVLEDRWAKIEWELASQRASQSWINAMQLRITELERVISELQTEKDMISPDLQDKVKGFMTDLIWENLTTTWINIEDLARSVSEMKKLLEDGTKLNLNDPAQVWNAVRLLLNKVLELKEELNQLKTWTKVSDKIINTGSTIIWSGTVIWTGKTVVGTGNTKREIEFK